MRGPKGIDSGTTFANRTIFRSVGCRFGRSSRPSDSFPGDASSSRTTMKREARAVCLPADDSQRRKTPKMAVFGLSVRKRRSYDRFGLSCESLKLSCESFTHEFESLPLEFQSLTHEFESLPLEFQSLTHEHGPSHSSFSRSHTSVSRSRSTDGCRHKRGSRCQPALGGGEASRFHRFRQARPSLKPKEE